MITDKDNITMDDVAKLAGVSKATVSKALNRLPVVKAETCARVFSACEQLGYRINPSVQDFLRQRINGHKQDIAFALVGVPFSSPGYAGMIEGVSQGVQAHRLYLILTSLSGRESHRYELPPEIRDGRAAGVVLSGVLSEPLITLVRETGTPYVILGNYPRTITAHADSVSVDVDAMFDLAVAELTARRKRRISFFYENPHNYFARECLAAFQRALQAHGLEFSPRRVFEGKGGEYNALDVMEAAYSHGAFDFDAIICINDLAAREAASEIIAHLGKSAANDIVMVTTTDQVRAINPLPTLQFVGLPHTLARIGLDLLIERLKKPSAEYKHITFTPKLCVEGTPQKNAVPSVATTHINCTADLKQMG